MKAKIYRILRYAMIVLYFLALIVPNIHRFSPVVGRIFPSYEETPLIGIHKADSVAPKFTMEDWFSGKYAADTDKWIKDHHGFATDLVRLHRYGLYKLTGQVVHAPATNTDTLIGENGYLYENLYVIDAVRKPGMSESDISKFVGGLEQVRDELKERNTAFVVILAPNKALICPENLPAWARDLSKYENSDYYLFKQELEKRGISCFDSNQYFKENWATHEQLHAPHSAHWSYYGAWMVFTNTIPLINAQQALDIELPVPELKEIYSMKAGGMDDELRPQLNLPRFCTDYSEKLVSEYPVPNPDLGDAFVCAKNAREKKLKALVIGDSYGFGLCDAMVRQPMFDEITYWYYCRTTYLVTGPNDYSKKRWLYANYNNMGIHNKKDAYEAYCKNADVVFYVVTTFNIDKLGWNFPKTMVHAFNNEQ